MKRKYVPNKIKTIPESAEKVFTGKIFDVYQWQQEMFDGTFDTFEMLKRPDTVNTVAIIDDKIVVTRQRQPRKDWFYSLPGGRADEEDEDELAAAKREMLEESGMSFANWKLVAVKQEYNKIDWLIYTFVATDLISKEEINPDAGEEIQVIEMSFDEVKELSRQKGNERRLSLFEDINSIEELKELPNLYL